MARFVVPSQAVISGEVTRRELVRDFTKVYRNVHTPRGTELTAEDRAEAGWLWSDRTAAVAGLSSIALHGSRWIDADTPVELARTRGRPPPGIVVHKGTFADDEVYQVWGIDCTTPARTAFDVGRRTPLRQAVIHVDDILNICEITVDDVAAFAARYRGARGVRQLRAVLDVADGGAQSPQETRLRLLVIDSGLPRPATQVSVGKYAIDLGWKQWRVGLEYEGKDHWSTTERYENDIDRYEILAKLGWRIVRVTSKRLYRNPGGVIARTRDALRRAGCPHWNAQRARHSGDLQSPRLP